ncbi:uncharacterized protein LOC132298983 [Cornus florida]|uniref:uncharacterized protein LOC132298983 n=1 Tax=Cornus florida TaxID=4283 RepID=UPI00289F6F52|nr:uncharacterized protein LOC132298983 [Cornus florida]
MMLKKNSILGSSYLNLCLFIILFVSCYGLSFEEQSSGPYNSFTVSSFTYAKTELKPYEWRYIRVDLPTWFSSMSIALESDVDLDPGSIKKVPKSTQPMICFREGSPPLPDVYNTSSTGLVLGPLSNVSSGGMQGLQNAEACYLMQKNISVKLTNEQIAPGIWYLGLFNGVGPTRTRSKMINRGLIYSFNGNVSVEGCTAPMLWGQYCNQTINPISCVDTYNSTSLNQTAANVVSCSNTDENSCHGDSESKVYSLDVVGIAEQLTVMAAKVRFNDTPSSNGTGDGSGIILMCYARHGAMPLATLHDYSGDINKAPLVIRSPKVGRWYISIQPVNISKEVGGVHNNSRTVCYSFYWQVLQCPVEKAGLNCTWERYTLQTVLRKNPTVPFESYYIPVRGKVSSDSANFPLEPLLSNSSDGGKLAVAWTYFLLDIPYGAAGGNIHIRLTSDVKVNYEIYAKYGGLPSLDSWDYFYENTTSSSNGSMFFKLYDSSKETVSFYILYVRGGTWTFGLRHPNPIDTASKSQTTMSISLERCPKRCSSHGQCQSVVDASGLTIYSFCSCDRDHGGFDCGVEIVSHQGHVWQSIFLIASNAAAILPAYRALRQKAFAESVLFTSSGISSALYHACDVGTWCASNFHALQFMDFWLSFWAVVGTFIYLTSLEEAAKRTIHTAIAIFTALLAETGPTRSRNIILIIALGTGCLFIGWLVDLCSTNYRSFSFPTGFYLNLLQSWQTVKEWLNSRMKKILKYFRWGFILAGFTALALAAISWKLESTDSYWIWHSIWHMSIYTSSFLFLCSKSITLNTEDQRPPAADYELTRQDSLSRRR